MNTHDDALSGPVWYMTRSGEFQGVIQGPLPDSWGYRRRAKAKYPGCTAWTYNHLGWCSMPVNEMQHSIWAPGTPPDVVLMGRLLEVSHESDKSW